MLNYSRNKVRKIICIRLIFIKEIINKYYFWKIWKKYKRSNKPIFKEVFKIKWKVIVVLNIYENEKEENKKNIKKEKKE